jgi:hypothetical protein
MKRAMLFGAALSLVVLATGLLYGTNRRNYQVADIYVCDQSLMMAQMQAMTKMSRQELYVVSYCDCMGFDKELKTEVRNDTCAPPKDSVYLCTCIGKSGY